MPTILADFRIHSSENLKDVTRVHAYHEMHSRSYVQLITHYADNSPLGTFNKKRAGAALMITITSSYSKVLLGGKRGVRGAECRKCGVWKMGITTTITGKMENAESCIYHEEKSCF